MIISGDVVMFVRNYRDEEGNVAYAGDIGLASCYDLSDWVYVDSSSTEWAGDYVSVSPNDHSVLEVL